MKPVLAVIHGSPRRGQHSDVLADAFISGLTADWKVEHLYAYQLSIKPCIGCEHCHRTGTCIYTDDMELVTGLLDRAACVVITSPVYFNSITGPLKVLIDRCQVYFARKFILKVSIPEKRREGVLLLSAGIAQNLESLAGSTKVMDYFFKAQTISQVGVLCWDQTDKEDDDHRELMLKEAEALGRQVSQ